MILNKIYILIFLIIVFIGVCFKAFLIPFGSLLLIIGCLGCSIISFLQFILSFVKIKNNLFLFFLSTSLNFILSLSFLAVLIKYSWWSGWTTMLNILSPLFLMLVFILVFAQKKYIKTEYEFYFTKNILWSCIVVFVLGFIAQILPNETFYNSFSQKRKQMTFEQFLEINNANE